MMSAPDCLITFYDIIITPHFGFRCKEADSFGDVSLNWEADLKNNVRKWTNDV